MGRRPTMPNARAIRSISGHLELWVKLRPRSGTPGGHGRPRPAKERLSARREQQNHRVEASRVIGARRAQRAAMAVHAARSTKRHEPSNEVARTRLHAHVHSTTKRADGYERRRPEETVLHKTVQRAWPSFVDRCDEGTGGGLPKFVRREVVRSAALLLRYALGLEAEAKAVERAVDLALDSGARTGDLAGRGNTANVGSAGMGDAIIAAIKNSA